MLSLDPSFWRGFCEKFYIPFPGVVTPEIRASVILNHIKSHELQFHQGLTRVQVITDRVIESLLESCPRYSLQQIEINVTGERLCPIRAVSLARIARKNPHLTQLLLRSDRANPFPNLSDSDLEQCTKLLSRLQRVALVFTGGSPEGVVKVSQNLSEVESMEITSHALTGRAVREALRPHTALKALTLETNSSKVDESSIESIAALCSGLQQLTIRVPKRSPNVAKLKDLRDLRELTLERKKPFADKDIEKICRYNPALRKLHLKPCSISEKALRTIAGAIPYIKSLALEGCSNPAGLRQRAVELMPQLTLARIS
jgi:hypothetical protein